MIRFFVAFVLTLPLYAQRGGPGSEEFTRQVVAGKPFSATEERHTLQVLGNGTRIENTQSNKLYRDAEGRTRIENMNGGISNADPVGGFRATLDPKNKTARKAIPFAAALPGWTAQIFQRTVDLVPFVGALAPNPTPEANENLGMQMVNGVWAQGTRSTVTIPKGQIGNDREIKVVTERWFSTDLNMMVKSTNSDPRFGDTTYQLTRIVTTVPEPGLFQIPADYTVQSNTGGVLGAGGARGRSGGRGGQAKE
jgi:hypothetical protein